MFVLVYAMQSKQISLMVSFHFHRMFSAIEWNQENIERKVFHDLGDVFFIQKNQPATNNSYDK